MTELNKAGRKTIVTSVSFSCIKRDDPLFPRYISENLRELSEVWEVWVGTRSGLLPERCSRRIFRTEKDAMAAVERHPVGFEFPDLVISHSGLDEWSTDYILEASTLGFDATAGDPDLQLAWEVLKGSGLRDEIGMSTSQHVSEFFGIDRVKNLKKKFGEDWGAVAEFEYCWLNLPHSSPTYIAAACQFNSFVMHDDFSAGYLLRDLEVLVHGIEAEATKAIEMRINAGKKGSETSARARKQRVEALMASLETVAERNPDIAAMLGPKSLLAIAIPEAAAANQSLWTQGQGQGEEYLGEIRRGEAGEGLKSRYLRIFSQKTA